MLTDTHLQHYSNSIVDVMRYIRNHINEPIDRETLAAVAGFSIPHFHRVFTAHLGESAVSYVRRLRMERAARKLRMGAVDIPRSRSLLGTIRTHHSARHSKSNLE